MSKKLIAVASAAALALSALAATPAAASFAFGVTVDGEVDGGNGLTSATPAIIWVPSGDVLRHISAASTSGTAVRLDILASTTSTTVRAVATGGIKLLTTAQYTVTSNRKTSVGVQTLEVTSDASDGTAGIYAYTTSTAVGTVTITEGGNSKVVYLQGNNEDPAYIYNLNFTAPTTADVSGKLKFTGTITDLFGNRIEALSAPFGTAGETSFFGSAVGLSAGADDDWEESTTDPGTYTFNVDTSATAGSGAVGLSKTVTRVTGFAAPRSSQFFTFTTSSLADQVTALTAQVAALEAKVAAKVTKKRYNRLARKWNAQNPNDKVKLKK